MHRLQEISRPDDIPDHLRDTPVGALLEYHNCEREFEDIDKAQLLVGTCMDFRIRLRMPDRFAFVIRTGGANLRYSEFNISAAIALGAIEHIAVIGHTDCQMVKLASREDRFVTGLNRVAGWEADQAHEHFQNLAPLFEIGNEVDFALSETRRLLNRYPNVRVTPLLYNVEDNRLYLIEERQR